MVDTVAVGPERTLAGGADETLAATAVDGEGEAVPSAIGPGTRIGRYEVLRLVGSGGMGVVFAARDPELDRNVAIKVLLGDHAHDGSLGRTRMLREAQALAKLAHPNVIAVHDVGTLAERVYIAMEFVDGPVLETWLQTSRSVREVIEVFVAAGRGLAAAHRAGLVHRDFKPGNVMIGADGRVRVMDFGLARRSDEAGGASVAVDTATSSALALPLTATGALMGTPAYMAPEQFLGRVPDAASDQFSFCVALFEALYGRRPFAGGTVHELAAAVLDGVIARPAGVDVPRRIRAAIDRGLRARPSERFASMDALLAALDRPPVWRRPLPMAAAATVALTGAFAIGALSQPLLGRCDDGRDAVSAAWSDRRTAIHDRIGEFDRPYAVHTAAMVTDALDQRAASLIAARRALCDARSMAPAILTRRTACLEQRTRELDALVGVLADADIEVIDRAIAMVDELPAVDRCDDSGGDALVDLPVEPSARRAALAVIDELAAVDALLASGRYAQADERSAEALTRAEALGHAALHGQAALRRARALAGRGEVRGAAGVLTTALREASAGADDWTVARVAIEMLDALAVGSDPAAEIARWDALARGSIARVHEPAALAIELDYAVAYAQLRAGDAQAALAAAEHGLTAAEAAHGRDHLEVARLLTARSAALAALGRPGDAVPDAERALDIERRFLGASHPRVSASLSDLAMALAEIGEVERAAAAFAEALAIEEAVYGPDNVALAPILTNVGEIESMQGHHAACEAANRRALALREAAHGPDHPEVAINLTNLGHALHMLGRDDEAQVVLERALAIRTRALAADHPALALTRMHLAEVSATRRDWPAALAGYEAVRAAWTARLGPEHPHVGVAWVQLGETRIASGAVAEGRDEMRRGLAILVAADGRDHPDVGRAQAQLGAALLAAGRADEAVDPLAEAIRILDLRGDDPDERTKLAALLAQARAIR